MRSIKSIFTNLLLIRGRGYWCRGARVRVWGSGLGRRSTPRCRLWWPTLTSMHSNLGSSPVVFAAHTPVMSGKRWCEGVDGARCDKGDPDDPAGHGRCRVSGTCSRKRRDGASGCGELRCGPAVFSKPRRGYVLSCQWPCWFVTDGHAVVRHVQPYATASA